MFNARQLLVHTQLLRAIVSTGLTHRHSETREYLLGAFQQYLRNQNEFTIWNIQADKLEPCSPTANYHPKSTFVENSVFAPLGRGNWASSAKQILRGRDWADAPWEAVTNEHLRSLVPELSERSHGQE